MVDNVALQVQPLQIQPNTGFVNSLLAASQIRNANTQNQLAEFGLQQKQGEQNALAEYSRLKQSGAENPEKALAQFPEAQQRQIGINSGLRKDIQEKTEWTLISQGRAAASVLALPPDQRQAAYNEQLDNGLKEGWLNALQHQSLKARPVNEQGLMQIVYRALPVEHAINQRNKEQDRLDFREGMRNLNQPEPPPGQVVSQGGGSVIGGLYGNNARIVSAPGMPDAPAPVAAPTEASGGTTPVPGSVAPAAATPLPERTPMDPFARALVQTMAVAPEGAKLGLKSVLDQHLKNSEPTNDIREYRAAVSQGYKGALTDFIRDNKKAGATLINTAEGMEAAQAKGRIAIDQAAIKDMAEKVTKSGSTIPLLQHLIAISKDTPQGFAGQVAPFAAKLASSVGIPVTQGMSNAEMWQSATRQLIPGVREPGSTSNYENHLYQAAVANASQSHEGRTKIADLLIRMQRRDQEIVALYRKHLGAPELSQKVAELSEKPIFTPEEYQWLELNGRAAEINQKPPQMQNTSNGIPWYRK